MSFITTYTKKYFDPLNVDESLLDAREDFISHLGTKELSVIVVSSLFLSPVAGFPNVSLIVLGSNVR